MPKRSMYVWKLQPVLNAEGGVARMISKARRARLSALWVKIADGASAYSNTVGATGAEFAKLIEKAHEVGLEVWGWHVPHCATAQAAAAESDRVAGIARAFGLDGLIMDAEGGGAFFHGDKEAADAYGRAMRAVAVELGKPLAISSNDIPQNIDGWLPRFNKIAFYADINFPQVYYGGSPSVEGRLSRAETGNAHVTIPFAPVGAGWIGPDGGCESASACAERAATFIALVKARGYAEYSFWHWGGAPLALWEVLNSTSA
ncbi:MAG: hypothetical protein LWW93_05675 [Hyphomicrobiales bacterium]|nr:hypothetical protein [Hyphomicrobiales bacterium]